MFHSEMFYLHPHQVFLMNNPLKQLTDSCPAASRELSPSLCFRATPRDNAAEVALFYLQSHQIKQRLTEDAAALTDADRFL